MDPAPKYEEHATPPAPHEIPPEETEVIELTPMGPKVDTVRRYDVAAAAG